MTAKVKHRLSNSFPHLAPHAISKPGLGAGGRAAGEKLIELSPKKIWFYNQNYNNLTFFNADAVREGLKNPLNLWS